MDKNFQGSLTKFLTRSFLGGIAWAAGASLGFTLLVALITFIINKLGGLPLVGQFIANIVAETLKFLQQPPVLP